jgi:hypothetical protein
MAPSMASWHAPCHFHSLSPAPGVLLRPRSGLAIPFNLAPACRHHSLSQAGQAHAGPALHLVHGGAADGGELPIVAGAGQEGPCALEGLELGHDVVVALALGPAFPAAAAAAAAATGAAAAAAMLPLVGAYHVIQGIHDLVIVL